MDSHRDIERLVDALDSVLCHGDKYKEFELIQLLQKPPYALFDSSALSNQLTLFQTHFLIYHCLYLLRQQYQQNDAGFLMITALEIQLINRQNQSPETQEDIKLQSYYLELRHLQETTEAEVNALIDDFWLRMGGRIVAQPSQSEIDEALRFFEVDVKTADWRTVKQQYRRKMHLLHPDKGGLTNDAQRAQQYFDILRHFFSPVG